MSLRSQTRARGGAAGVWFILCAAALAAGLSFDFAGFHPPAFWVAARTGAGAALGAAAALFVVCASHVARTVLAKRKEEGDAGDHP